MAREDNNEMTTTKKKIQGPGVVKKWASDDASDDDSADPPYEPRDNDESSESSDFDDEDTDAIIVQSSTTMSAKLMEKNKNELEMIVLTQRMQIIGLKERLEKEKKSKNQSKKQVKIIQNWTGERKQLMLTVSHSSAKVLFLKYKFLKKGWNEYDNSRSSLSSLVKCHITTPEGSNYENIWERVAVPTIWLKYINMKCNLNNEIKDAYKSECQNIR